MSSWILLYVTEPDRFGIKHTAWKAKRYVKTALTASLESDEHLLPLSFSPILHVTWLEKVGFRAF